MGRMRRFYEEQRFWELSPYQTGKDAVGDPFGKKMPLITVAKDKGRFVLYYPESVRKSGDIDMPSGKYAMRWFDPRNGIYGEAQEFEVEQDTWRLPAKPDLNDWCLVVEREIAGI